MSVVTTPEQEEVDRATAQLLITLAFLMPRGTNMMAALGTELLAFKSAVVAMERARKEAE